MTQVLDQRQSAEARALVVALGLAALADWPVRHAGPVLSSPYAGYLYAEQAELLLVPTTASLEWQRPIVDKAMREARSDALIVSLPADAGVDRLQLALGLWQRERNDWHMPVDLMLEGRSRRWLQAEDGEMFPLLRGRTIPASPCWQACGDAVEGKRKARECLSKLLR